MIQLALDKAVGFYNTRTVREQLLLLIFAASLVLSLDYFVLIRPVQRIFADTLPKLGSLKRELKSLKDDKKNKALLEAHWQETTAKLGEAEKSFVDSDEVSALLEELSRLAQASGVKITTLKPITIARAGEGLVYSPVPIKMNALAGTHELGRFLVKLETSRPFFKVTDMRIVENQMDSRKHQIDLELESYRKG